MLKRTQEFNQQILSLIQSIINRVENIEHRLDKLESRIDDLVVENNLKKWFKFYLATIRYVMIVYEANY